MQEQIEKLTADALAAVSTADDVATLENFAYGLALERGGFCERLQVPAPAGTGETLEVELRRNGERELRAGEGERELLRLRAPLPMIFDVAAVNPDALPKRTVTGQIVS